MVYDTFVTLIVGNILCVSTQHAFCYVFVLLSKKVILVNPFNSI